MRYAITDKNISHYRGPLDNLGVMLDLPRLPEEDNPTYRARLESVFASPGNATYFGMVNSIAREFGLTITEAVTITPETPSISQVILKDQTLYLYYDGDIEATWFLRAAPVIILNDLINEINDTDHFTATLNSGAAGEWLSSGLIHYDSKIWVADEIIPPSRIFHLKNVPIVDGSLSFEEGDVFYRYWPNPTINGDFEVDVATGLVKTVTVPSGRGRVAYLYQGTESVLRHLPFSLFDLNCTAARDWFFSTVPRDIWNIPEDSLSPAFPHPFMKRIISEITKNCPSQWGS
jgi:hypothetical protein